MVEFLYCGKRHVRIEQKRILGGYVFDKVRTICLLILDIFVRKNILEHAGWILNGNVFERKGETYLPLMEAKLIHHYNHRFSTFNSAGSDSQNVELSTATRCQLYYFAKVLGSET